MTRFSVAGYAFACIASLLAAPALGQQPAEPGGDATAAQMAEFQPNEYAWRLFLFMNHPAKPGVAGVADGTKKLGEDAAAVVWETWALESGSRRNDAVSHSEVYKADGSKPLPWDKLPRSTRTLQLDRSLERLLVLSNSSRIAPRFDIQSPDNQEVRSNQAMFEFIVTNGLYNLDGLEKLYSNAVGKNDRLYIQFPQGSKEIKAQWNPIPDDQKGRYLWREATGPDGKTHPYGLVSLHVITKDLTNWFWADFGHVDCETRSGACNNQWLASVFPPNQFVEQEKAQTVLRDSTTIGSNGVRMETQGTFWQYYRLRGTETNFIDTIGQPNILSNPVIENGFQQSSCMTCHARASVGKTKVVNGKPQDQPNTLNPGDPQIGIPNEGLFGAAPGQSASIEYLQTDFIWSAPFRVHRCSISTGCGD